ncbi:MAG TPA: hypothetical protein VK817_23740 [Trebonia sp.]|nr:hypothetical protein [Trebonia sp.]
MGLTLGVVIAVSSHSGPTNVNQSAFGRHRFGGGGTNTQGDLAAGANAQDAAGNPFSFNQTAAQALNTMDCTLTVPANPLTAQGLATPWQLGDGCSWANGGTEGAFVEATILAPNGQVQVYDPLVVDQGTTAAVAPTPPTIAAGSQVIISAGFNGNALAVTGAGATQGKCIDALGNSIINQTPQCNAAAFYQLANQEIANGTLTVPPVGTGKDGQPCETTTSFPLIDQDQSDNVDTSYLFNATTGQTAQNTAANVANLQGFTNENNGSDDGLLDAFVNPALGCTPFTAPNTTAAAGTSSSQALNALSARQNQPATPALLPVNDPQLLVGGNFSVAKTNVYRAETDQPLLPANTSTAQNAATYCQNMVNLQTPVLKLDAPMETGASPVPALGSTLANFLAARENASFTNLNCQNFGLTNPVTLTLDGNGVAIGATYNTATQTANANGGAAAAPSASASTCPSASAVASASPSTVASASASATASASASASPSASAAASASPSASAVASASPSACAPAASPSPTASAGTHRHMNPRFFMPGGRGHV